MDILDYKSNFERTVRRSPGAVEVENPIFQRVSGKDSRIVKTKVHIDPECQLAIADIGFDVICVNHQEPVRRVEVEFVQGGITIEQASQIIKGTIQGASGAGAAGLE